MGKIMKTKNILKNIAIAGLLTTVVIGAAYAQQLVVNEGAICQLLQSLQGIFRLLRNLTFIGAAFILLGWAWAYIQKGEFKWKDDEKNKWIAMLVGFLLLFGVGAILSFLMTATGANLVGGIGCDIAAGW